MERGGWLVDLLGAVPSGYLDHPRPLAFAHRGGAGHFPENSWKAFEHAVDLGYAYLETDAHATSDGTVVAFHDRSLDRVTDGTGRIADLTAAEVAAARIGGTEPIPLLADLIMAWSDVRFNIDVKDEPVIGPLVDVLRWTNCWDRVSVRSSFPGSRSASARSSATPLAQSGDRPGSARQRRSGRLGSAAR